MANRHKGEVVLEWGERKLVLLLDINALAELEDMLGETIRKIVPKLNDPTLNLMKAIIWAATREHAPDIDLKAAGRIIQAIGVPAARDKITEAFQAAFPSDQDVQAGEGGAAAEDPQMATTPKPNDAGTGDAS